MSAQVASPPGPPAVVASVWVAQGGRKALVTTALPLLAVAGVAWLMTARTAGMSMSQGIAFIGSWLVMMTAMMLPAVAPVVALYSLAARRRVVAAVPFFLAGYACVWAVSALPAYLVSRVVTEPLMDGRPWVARVVGATLVVAGLYQLTPLKASCLRRCRTPMSFFLTRRASLSHPARALAAGAEHGLYCLGCCWAIMAVLIVLGGMQLGWALALALVLSAEKLLTYGPQLVRVTAAAALSLGFALLIAPSLLIHLISV